MFLFEASVEVLENFVSCSFSKATFRLTAFKFAIHVFVEDMFAQKHWIIK